MCSEAAKGHACFIHVGKGTCLPCLCRYRIALSDKDGNPAGALFISVRLEKGGAEGVGECAHGVTVA